MSLFARLLAQMKESDRPDQNGRYYPPEVLDEAFKKMEAKVPAITIDSMSQLQAMEAARITSISVARSPVLAVDFERGDHPLKESPIEFPIFEFSSAQFPDNKLTIGLDKDMKVSYKSKFPSSEDFYPAKTLIAGRGRTLRYAYDLDYDLGLLKDVYFGKEYYMEKIPPRTGDERTQVTVYTMRGYNTEPIEKPKQKYLTRKTVVKLLHGDVKPKTLLQKLLQK